MSQHNYNDVLAITIKSHGQVTIRWGSIEHYMDQSRLLFIIDIA